jgi:hypothetical protein
VRDDVVEATVLDNAHHEAVFASGHVRKRRKGTAQFAKIHPVLPSDSMPRAIAPVQHLLSLIKRNHLLHPFCQRRRFPIAGF